MEYFSGNAQSFGRARPVNSR